MGKTTLLLDENHVTEFGLLAIACHEPDYRACWILNQALNVALVRVEDLNPADTVEKAESGFSRFHFLNPAGGFELDLISNHSANRILLPVHKNVDFFLKISGEERIMNLKEMIPILRRAEGILTVFEIPLKDRRTKQAFIF